MYVIITGGVTSSLGKGIAAASLAALLQARGYSVCLKKLDPYLNIDPGTLSPLQHGEVFVTADGAETDLDLGHYERFTGIECSRENYVTTGQIYSTVLERERRGDYLGSTVQVVPHVTDEMQAFIQAPTGNVKADITICEIGGTVGDIECVPYLEAARQLRQRLGRHRVLFLHLTLVPYVGDELKTKPTQQAVRTLLQAGIQADLLLCRTASPLSLAAQQKIAMFCGVTQEDVIVGQHAASIYDVPMQYHHAGLDERVCHHLGLARLPDLTRWLPRVLSHPPLRIGVVAKYALPDAYQSLVQALVHAGMAHQCPIEIRWIDAEGLERLEGLKAFLPLDGMVLPGGFGERGTEGMMVASRYGREHGIPTLGICFGMQMMVVEACRTLLHLPAASSTEFGPTAEPVIDLLQGREATKGYGGTLRRGTYPCVLREGSRAAEAYCAQHVLERHRHRYEVNLAYQERLAAANIVFTGMSPDESLPEIVEFDAAGDKQAVWWMGVQFHPEFRSRPFAPHPLFVAFVTAALKRT